MKRKSLHASVRALVPLLIFVFAASTQAPTPYGRLVRNVLTQATNASADAMYAYAVRTLGAPGSNRQDIFVHQADAPTVTGSSIGQLLVDSYATIADATDVVDDAIAESSFLGADAVGSFYAGVNRVVPGRNVPEHLADTVFFASQQQAAARAAIDSSFASLDRAAQRLGGGYADGALAGADVVGSFYASLNERLPGREYPQQLTGALSGMTRNLYATADAFAGSSAAINGTSANILDSIGSAIGSAADAVQSFFLSFLSRPPVVSTVSPSVSVTSSPSVPASGGTTVTNISTTTSITQAQLVSALRTLLSQGLPADILAQLKGPKGDPGLTGIQGPSGYSIGAVYSNPTYPNSAGTLGGVTYFGAKEVTTQSLTATGATSLASLTTSGATSLASLAVTGATSLASLTVSGTATLGDISVPALDVAGHVSVSGTFEAGVLKGDGQQLTLARIGSSTYSTIQHMQTVYHSTGWVSGGSIVDNGDGSIIVNDGTGLIRNSNDSLATLAFFDWAASGSFSLTNNADNFIYIDYNGGSPKVTVLLAEDTSDYHTRFLLAKVVRIGTTLHINEEVKPTVGDHAALMIREMQQTMPYANSSGGEIAAAASNPLAFTIAAGAWWQGLNRFDTPAFDGSTDTFSYFYRNGTGGWTEVPGSTQLDNTRYDDGDGTLGTLGAGRYGVHWIYMETNGSVSVVYGSGSYTLNQAQNAGELTDIPVQLTGAGFIVGKVIIANGAASMTQIESVAMAEEHFTSRPIADHNSLITLQGGTTDEYYHLTLAQHDRLASASSTLAAMSNCSSGTTSKLLYNPTTGVFSCGVDQNTGGGGGGSIEFREFRPGGFDSFPATASFDANAFNLTASGSDVSIALDWINGPASRTAAQTISGGWLFSAASNQFSNTLEIGTASISTATIANLSLSGGLNAATLNISGASVLGGHVQFSAGASVATNLEVSGTASISQYFGGGLTSCNADEFSKLQYDSTTGRFSCVSVSGGARMEQNGATVIEHVRSIDFEGTGFTSVASGTTEDLIYLNWTTGPASRTADQTITGAWSFTAPASFSSTLEAGTLKAPRFGSDTGLLTITGIASVSGNLYAMGNVGIGTVSPTSRLTVLGTTNDSTANALAITNTDATPLLTIRNDGMGAVGMQPTLNATFVVKSQTFNGTADASTTGSSTTVTTTGGAFANVVAGATIIANGQTVQVITHVSDNTVITRTPIDLTGGFPFTYTNASFIAADSNASTSAGLRILNQGNPVWNINSVGAESNRYLYVFSNNARANILRITEMGTIGQNIPYSAANTLVDPPATYAIYPQAFGAVMGSISGTFYDLTTNANTSTDTPTPFTVTPNTDFLYVGIARKFSSVFLERVTGPTSGVVKAEYWNGSSWITLSGANAFADATNGFTESGALSWNKDSLTGWTTRSVNGSSSYYFIRLSFTTYIGGPLRINMIVPGTEDRLAIFKAPLDTNPAFQVNGVGDVGLGNRLRNSRIQDTSVEDDAALSVIDTRGSLRLWAFDASKSAELQLVAGTGSVSDNLHWDIRLASVSGPYGTEGLSIRHYVSGVGHNAMTFNNMNYPGVSATGATMTNDIGAMDGNDLMTGFSIDMLGNTYTGSGNELRALVVGGITPSANASESAIVVGSGWDYAFIASQGNVGIGTETPNYRLEVGGAASVSQFYGAGLADCSTAERLRWDSASGTFNCLSASTLTGVPFAIRESGSAYINAASASFDAGGFNVTNVADEARIFIDYINGPASRSIAQTITGHWDFTAPASVSAALDVSGALTAGTYFGGGLTTCNGATQKLTWTGGSFGCGVDQNTGGGGATGSLEIREFGAAYDSFPATVSFDPGKFNLTASGASDVTISLDWGAGGPASLSQDEVVTGQWTFNAAQVGFIVANNASISGALEVSGYASSSKIFGAGLTDCSGTFNVIRWSASTGKFSCGTEGGGIRTELGETTIVANNNALNFSANRFAVTASGGTETVVDLNLAGQWTFTGGVSVSSNPFEVGTHALYVNPTTSRVGINTQNLSEALEIVGNASVSGAVYAATATIGSGTLPAGYVLDVGGAAHFGNGSDANQILLGFDVNHDLTMHYMIDQYGQSGFDGLMIRNGDPTESNIFSVYGSSDAQFNAASQDSTRNASIVVMNNPSVTSLAASTRGILTNKATTHDIALQYSFGGQAPIDAILIDTDPAANTINSVIINNGNQNIPFRVAGIGDANLLYTDGTSKVGIGTTAPLTKLEVQGTASASNLLTTGGLQVGGGSSVSYSRLGTNATTHGLNSTASLLISSRLEVDGDTFFDANASVSGNVEIGGTASVSGSMTVSGAGSGLTFSGTGTHTIQGSAGTLTLGALTLGGAVTGNAQSVTGLNNLTFVFGSASGTFEALTLKATTLGADAGLTIAPTSGLTNITGAASVSTNIEVAGNASASRTFGSGLTDCDSYGERVIWTASGSNAGKFGCTTNKVTATYMSGAAAIAANAVQVAGIFTNTNTTAFTTVPGANTASGSFTATTGGSFRGCSIVMDSNVTAGSLGVVFRRNGVSIGSTYCKLTTAVPKAHTETVPGGALTFNAGDNIGVAVSASLGYTPTGTEVMITWTVDYGSGADVAETYYTNDDTIIPGMVVSIDDSLWMGVRRASGAYDEQTLGVISEAPGLILGDTAGPGRKANVALSGRVPVWVSTENGPIHAGDWLTASSERGAAMKATRAGRVIGQALTEYTGDGIGKVIMFVKNTQYTGERTIDGLTTQSADARSLLTALDRIGTSASVSASIFSDRLIAGLDVIAPTITTRELSAVTFRIGSDSYAFETLVADQIKLASISATVDALSAFASAALDFRVQTLEREDLLTSAIVAVQHSIASQSARVDALALRLATAELDLAALASHAEGLTFEDTVLFSGGLRVDTVSAISNLLTFGSDTYFFGRPYFNDDTAGFAVIRTGTREVRIPFTAPYLEAPVVNVSLMTTASQSVDDLLVSDVRYAIASVSGDGFTIRLSADAAADVRLSWIALAVHSARTVFSQIPVEPTPADIPVGTTTPTPETPVQSVEATPDITPSPEPSVSETPTPTPDMTADTTPEPNPVPTATPDNVPTMTPEPTPTPDSTTSVPTESAPAL